MASIKVISSTPQSFENSLNFQWRESTISRIRTLCVRLERDLGFSVTEEQAVLWMLKKADISFCESFDFDVEAEKLYTGKAGGKIFAIKYVREHTGWGLKESKDYVEAKWGSEEEKRRAAYALEQCKSWPIKPLVPNQN